ncbi:MAG: orotidine-5'-phosphate decarboxylase [Chloroflexi bacterium]|nr:orotidine-5'-phosphate decarboxylase [Chloroflexota bacterium]
MNGRILHNLHLGGWRRRDVSELVERFLAASRTNDSLLCVGLDVDPARVPAHLRQRPDWVVAFNAGLIEATADLVCAYKPNLAFYEALGLDGWRALKATVGLVPKHLPVIGDAKRGDVGHSSAAYAQALFDEFGFDAITVHAYPGHDGVAPFLARPDRGAFLLCHMSNPGSVDFQDLPCRYQGQEMPLYQAVARKAVEWNRLGNCGLVVGATFARDLAQVRTLAPELLILVPGVGPQAGDLEASVQAGVDAAGERALISASRQVIYASAGHDWAEAARASAQALRLAINRARRPGGRG